MPEPIEHTDVEYTDKVAQANPYVDKIEEPVEKAIPKRMAKSFRAKKNKAKRKNKIEEESVRPVLGSIDEGNFPDEGIMESSVVAPTHFPAASNSSIEKPLMVSDVMTSWYFLFGLLALGLTGWYSFAKRRGKRGLVFN